MSLDRFISEALDQPATAITYCVSQRLAEFYPDRAVIEGEDLDFTLLDYVREGYCTLRRKEAVHGQRAVWWSADRGLWEVPKNVWYEVQWRDHDLEVLFLECGESCFGTHYWIVAESDTVARRFFQTVCEYDPEVQEEVLVYDGGRWTENAGLFRAIQGAGFDNLVLAGTLKDDIRRDLERFFAARATYEALGAPWKRGILFTGPPGNGKTHTIKALVHTLGRPCLYVKSFQSDKWGEQTNIRRHLRARRRAAPCLLVLEDLDSLITDENRSFFLNELDGFAANAGIVTLATTNHPEKLDPAIVERPSRFDRKYEFPLPGFLERRAYIEQWQRNIPAPLRLDKPDRKDVAQRTEGFSFAYLKELFLSSVLARAAAPEGAAMTAILRDQTAALREQMGKANPAAISHQPSIIR